tara:strand:+ start:65 stop:610 length:546 start_codon:yes stop_codon:yes gene_type:complete
MSFFESESTGRATQNIDEILRENMEATHSERLAREGSIGPVDEPIISDEDIIDMVSGLGPVGRLGKEFFTGGSAMKDISSKLKHWKDWRHHNTGMSFKDYMKGIYNRNMMDDVEGIVRKHPKSIDDYKALNKANKERLMAEKALDKHGIPHNPIEETDLALRRDPISFLLAKIKESRKPDF